MQQPQLRAKFDNLHPKALGIRLIDPLGDELGQEDLRFVQG
jgi:hypothetical protein